MAALWEYEYVKSDFDWINLKFVFISKYLIVVKKVPDVVSTVNG